MELPGGWFFLMRHMSSLLSLSGVQFLLFSCIAFHPVPDLTTSSLARVGDPKLSNAAYSGRLAQDGWPVHLLNTAADHHYLKDDEKNLVLAHNLVRYDPKKFARLYVTEFISYYEGNLFNYPGQDWIIKTIEGNIPAIELYWELLDTEPMNLLIPSKGLHLAAALHADYMSANKTTGHEGLGGVAGRAERFGVWDHSLGENIAYNTISPHDALLVLLINDNNPERGHRKNILFPGFRFIGVGLDYHPLYQEGDTYVVKYAGTFNDHR